MLARRFTRFKPVDDGSDAAANSCGNDSADGGTATTGDSPITVGNHSPGGELSQRRDCSVPPADDTDASMIPKHPNDRRNDRKLNPVNRRDCSS